MGRQLGLRIGRICLAAAFLAAAAASWPMEDAVFDLEYRGLVKGVSEEYQFGYWFGCSLAKKASTDFQ